MAKCKTRGRPIRAKTIAAQHRLVLNTEKKLEKQRDKLTKMKAKALRCVMSPSEALAAAKSH